MERDVEAKRVPATPGQHECRGGDARNRMGRRAGARGCGRLEDRDVVAPVGAELKQPCRYHLASIVTLAAERDAGVSGVVPADTLLLGDRALQLVEEFLRGAGQGDDAADRSCSSSSRECRRSRASEHPAAIA